MDTLNDATLIFAIVPSVFREERGRDSLDRLSFVLSEHVGRRILGVAAYSYGEVLAELEAGRAHFAWMPPMLLVLAEERVGVRPLLSSVRGGRTDYCGLLFVDGASRYRTVDELKGRRIAWVDRASASGYFYPRLQLLAQKIDAPRFFAEELFLGSHREVVRAVFDGRAEVGATFGNPHEHAASPARASFRAIDPGHPVRVLEWTRPIPNDLVVGHGALPDSIHRDFAAALVQLSSDSGGQALLRGVFHADSFAAVAPDALERLRGLVQLAASHGLVPRL